MGDIGWAVEQLKAGRLVRRPAWNGKGMWLSLSVTPLAPTPGDLLPFVTMRTATGQFQPGWVCSQADLLATDWELADGAADAPPQG